ncbi:MAG: NAD(P)/FAD-dependent oxidoreductase [Desulfovibrio sp.]
MQTVDVLIIGGGAAGLFCAWECGQRGRKTLVLDHSKKLARKVRISGGGKCNFTNMDISHENYHCENPHFVKSALARFSQWEMISLVSEAGINYEERDHGRLFFTTSSMDLVHLLENNCRQNGVEFSLGEQITSITKKDDLFTVKTDQSTISASSVVIATGGPSWPKAGATDFGQNIGKQFGLKVLPMRPALVPLTAKGRDLKRCNGLTGNSQTVTISAGGRSFTDQLLFTHRGLSGPAALQGSLFMKTKEPLVINLLPEINFQNWIEENRSSNTLTRNLLGRILPKKLPALFFPEKLMEAPFCELSNDDIQYIEKELTHWEFTPAGTEGMAKAEVAVGGVDTNGISSKTMEAREVSGLYFIGEVLDVAGMLGGYNLHWAWASGHAAGQFA